MKKAYMVSWSNLERGMQHIKDLKPQGSTEMSWDTWECKGAQQFGQRAFEV